MIRFIIALILTNSLLGCASGLNIPTSKAISFLEVESLMIGKDTRLEVQAKLGNPAKVIYFDGKKITPEGVQEVWIYYQSLDGEQTQRASLSIDRKTGILMNSAWIPFASDQDNFSNFQAVVSHFKNLDFKIEKPKPMGDGHYYSGEIYYKSQETGISFAVNNHSHAVTSIMIGMPEKIRTPATR